MTLTKSISCSSVLGKAREVILLEAKALERSSKNLTPSFYQAVEVLSQCKGKVIITGLGKSGQVAAKISSTMSSTGTSSIFLHASDAMHGDFGMFLKEDCLVAITYGGETREVLAVVSFAKKLNVPVLGITGNLTSSLAKLCDFVLDGSVEREADILGLAPTASSAVALALGDALAVCLMKAKGFTKEDFAVYHPGGELGRSLAKVSEFMHEISSLHLISPRGSFLDALKAISGANFGIAAVVAEDSEKKILGCISDGDIRRVLLSKGKGVWEEKIENLMTQAPKTIDREASLLQAVSLMEQAKITSLFVVSQTEVPCLEGIVRLHDLLAAKVI